MASKDYNFQYTPLTGRLPGKSFVKQTEKAINELAEIVNEGSAQVDVITNLANTANDNSEEALEKANEALETVGRMYITLPNLDDADDYFDSQLYYFANSHSANLPVEYTGFLEVKTNDSKTACEQVFIADDTGLCYFRHGVITSEEVGSETVYSVTWGTWSSELASEDYVQQEASKYLPLAGGTLTGALTGTDATFSGTISGDLTGHVTGTADTPTAGDDSTKIATTEYVKDNVPVSVGDSDTPVYTDSNGKIVSTGKKFSEYVPTGCVQAFAGSTTPNGWLLCDGSAVSRTTYADLFAVIGTTYGVGDGSTTFNLPDLVDKFVEGSSTAGTVKSAGLPNITGSIRSRGFVNSGNWCVETASGSFVRSGVSAPSDLKASATSGDATSKDYTFDASLSSAIYGSSTTVQPPAVTMRYIIKY